MNNITNIVALGLGVDFTFSWDTNNNNNNNNNHNNHNNNNNNINDKNPHLNFLKGTALGDKEQGVGIRVKSQRIIRDKT